MAAINWPRCYARVLIHEGGFVNDPRDPGGPTNFGVTIADARRYGKELGWIEKPSVNDMRNMPKSFAEKVFKLKYWEALECYALPAGVDNAVFDYAVNSGIGRAGKVLRRVVGLPDDTWRITPAVLDAVKKQDPTNLVAAISIERLDFMHGLETWKTFGRGWAIRVNEVRSYSIALAHAAARGSDPQPGHFTPPDPSHPSGKAIIPPPPVADSAFTWAAVSALSCGVLWYAGVPLIDALALLVTVVGTVSAWAWHSISIYHRDFTTQQEASSKPKVKNNGI